ncbi:MAG: MFS transporter, partial [Alphaproteobacteria bacterium]
ILQPAWDMTNEQAGWLSGILFGGYVVAVPFLVTVTDHRDARGIMFIGFGLSFLGLAGMALAGDGFWPALFWRALTGAGLAGTYMPGLKVLADRLEPSRHARAVAFYTASFSVGAGVSYLASGLLFQVMSWQGVFAVIALGPVVSAAAAMLLILPRQPERPEGKQRHALDVRPVLKSPQTMGFVLAYAGHTAELFAMRSWLVPFVVSSFAFHGVANEVDASVVATTVSFVAVLSSLAGAELAIRIGRVRLIAAAMVISFLVALVTGFSVALPIWIVVALCLIYAMTIQADSAAITAGAVAMAPKGHRGATLAVHSVVGFSGALIGPPIVGVMLDHMGGQSSVLAWGLSFTLMGCFGLFGLACLLWLGRQARGCALR